MVNDVSVAIRDEMAKYKEPTFEHDWLVFSKYYDRKVLQYAPIDFIRGATFEQLRSGRD